ncbi:type IV pilus biogenesis/stability protein PilW [Azoarcus taiwanensis]|mgnify:CR=1 FL=1|uniref:Type IV pilus biogenesis/stability protein PilW n=1 Tax=Azoarcus taiwanensis TaxID=666964 RepID=A0A972F6C3_9RHOO|nr:type IV pilus biogenesis/stability protein PilW [Azoarcus taiwanensis]NMG01730.1 type IV pilus biogenesis/stability protein PilW [Azoarcus taiwanensis]
MKRHLLPLMLSAAVLAGCATTMPGGGAPTTTDRPMLDSPPANQAQARAMVNVELGTAYLEVGRFDVAMDEARNALTHAPSYPPAFHLLGLVYMFVGDTAAAEDYFQRALRAAPNDPDFNNSYGWFLCGTGREEEGLRRLELAARNPYYRHATRPYTNAGLCYLRLNNNEAAREQFRRAVLVDGSNAQALYNLAAIDYLRGDFASTRDLMVQFHQQLEPTAETVWLGLRAERRLGNRDAEASYAAQLSGRFRDSPEYQSMMRGDYQ